MNPTVLFRCTGVLLLITALPLACGELALGSQGLKERTQAQTPDVVPNTQEPCDTTVETLFAATSVAYYWQQPPLHPFLSERYEMPIDHSGTLEYIQFGVYELTTSGTPDPYVYVWFSDGTFPLDDDPPSQAIAEFHLQYEDVVYFPDLTTVQAYPLGIMLDPGELFHVGLSHAFEVDDTLAYLSDTGDIPNDRTSVWNGSAWESLAPYLFLVDVGICPIQWHSTYTMECGPRVGFASPGDPPSDLYHVHVGSILGYNQTVTLSLLSVDPADDISVSFTPNGDPCPYSSNVTVAVDGEVPYGDYELVFQAVGGDGQTKTCDVTLRVQPPYDEAEVDFHHGMQRATNYGAVASIESERNFLWYADNYLFDGTFLIAGSDPDHMALDVYDCEHRGWIPTEHMNVYYDPVYDANIAYANFFSETIPGEYDSLFVVCIMQDSVDFSIKINIHYNPSETPIPQLYAGLYEDWDIGDYLRNWVEMDTIHNLMYMYESTDPSIVMGVNRAPFYDEPMHSMIAVHILEEIRPNEGFCDSVAGWYGLDSLFVLMSDPHPHYRPSDWFDPSPSDFALLMVAPPFSLNPGDGHIEVWIDFGRDLGDGMTWEQWYHKILRYVGFYRGDVTPPSLGEQPVLDVGDVIHLVNYLFKAGPAPFPYPDQGDVNADYLVNLGDLVYLIVYLYRGGRPPNDYIRFIPSFWSRPSLFTNPDWL